MNYINLPDEAIKACLNNSEHARKAYAHIAHQFNSKQALIKPPSKLECEAAWETLQILNEAAEGDDYHVVDELEALTQRIWNARPNRASILQATCNRVISALNRIKLDCSRIYEQNHMWDNDPL